MPHLKCKFFTVGCKANQYDTQVIREQFLKAGMLETEGRLADYYIINTCSVTADADRTCRLLIRNGQKANPRAKIIVTGCYVDYAGREIKNISRKIIVVKNIDKFNILEKLEIGKTTQHGITGFKGHTRAFVKIQDGCDNFCSYCIVPFLRGRPKSRRPDEILAEIKNLIAFGYKEIVLTGINLGAYGVDLKEKSSLADVLKKIEAIKGKYRLRLSSIEPQYVSNELIDIMAKSRVICPHLHLPLQSGDDGVLKLMNRKYNRRDFLNLCRRLKSKIRDLAITTDVIAGFPAETDTAFNNTVKLVKIIGFSRVHVFPYSARKMTKASKLAQLTPELIKKRTKFLYNLSCRLAVTFDKRYIGKTLNVLVESQKQGKCLGFSQNYIKVAFMSNKPGKNRLILVKITGMNSQGVKGELA